MFSKLLNFKSRKIIHYSLIFCILLIQLMIAGFFYNEFVAKKKLSFIEKQLKEIRTLEHVADDSKKELLNAQVFLEQYVVTDDKKYLELYFNSLKILEKNLDKVSLYEDRFPRLKNVLFAQTNDSLQVGKLKTLIDSTYHFSTKNNLKFPNEIPNLTQYDYDLDRFDFNIETKTFADTVKKKGLFGRLGDAISGKENVRKDSTVITVNHRKKPDAVRVKQELNDIIHSAENHYIKEVEKIQLNIRDKQNNSGKVYQMFSKLLVYSSGLMNVYEAAVKGSKADLEQEYNQHNSESNKVRTNLIFGSMILMFIVSVLIMFLTRIAFIYERKLNAANQQIHENLNFKNRILGMLSHELRSPLKIIGIFINRINKKTDDEKIKEYLKSISFTNDTLLMQANQILEYTKNQAVENKLLPVVFNLKKEILSILNAIEPYIETRNNTFVIHENIDPELEVDADNKKINQVFMNILGNANKFTENGKIEVTAFVKPVTDGVMALTTEIKDTGAGISKADLEKIFEPYYQGVLSEDVENLGAGLGLSLCKEIVGLYFGTISVESEIGKGTTVIFTLNLNRSK